jgi:FtsZ-binding cell division protein ZapB
MNESGSVRLLHMEIERLKEENERLAQSVTDTETKVILYHYVDKVRMY